MSGRVLNGMLFWLVAAVAVVVIDYGIAEKTRIASVELDKVATDIKAEDGRLHDLDVAFKMQELKDLPADATPTVQYASLTQLPRREAPEATVREISAPVGESVLVPVAARN